jgi:hypothetical protein
MRVLEVTMGHRRFGTPCRTVLCFIVACGCATPVVPAAPVSPRHDSTVTSPVSIPRDEGTSLIEIAHLLTPDPASSWDARRLWLLSFRDENGAVHMTGQAVDGEDVSEFLRRLSNRPRFTHVVLGPGRLRETAASRVVEFEITANVMDAGHIVIERPEEAKGDFGPGNRNPFERRAPPAPKPAEDARPVAEAYSLGELHLIALVTADPPRAMLVDPSGKAWVAKVGDLVGRLDAPTGSPSSPACRWRVGRIDEASVVFVRGDAATCPALPAERAMNLAR